MDTDVLRWFQEVADGVTVTEVAELFMVSQPAVSRALARLETEAGTPLFNRVGRVLRPTHAGTVFKRHVDSLIHALDDGLAAVNEVLDPGTGTVSIGFQQSFGSWLVPQLIRGFRLEHPEVTFVLHPSHDALGSSLVAQGRIDLEITARRPRNPEVYWQPLLSEPLVLALPPRHPLADRSEVSLTEVRREAFVMLRPTWELRSVCEELCSAAGFTPRVAFEGDDLPTVRGFVVAGLGVAIVPTAGRAAGDTRASTSPTIPLSDRGAHRQVGLAWSQSRRLLPSAALFREHVLTARLIQQHDGEPSKEATSQ